MYMIKDTRFAFVILTGLQKIHSFILELSSEAISIDQLGSNAPKLHTYRYLPHSYLFSLV